MALSSRAIGQSNRSFGLTSFLVALFLATQAAAQFDCIVFPKEPITGVTGITHLSDAEILVASLDGLFRVNARTYAVDRIASPPTLFLKPMSGKEILVGTTREILRYEINRNESYTLKRLDEGRLPTAAFVLPNDAVLLGTDDGLQHLNLTTFEVTSLGARRSVRAMLPTPTGLLIATGSAGSPERWDYYDFANGQLQTVTAPRSFRSSPNLTVSANGLLVNRPSQERYSALLARFDLNARSIVYVEDERKDVIGRQLLVLDLPNGDSLVGSDSTFGDDSGLFRFESTTGRLTPITSPMKVIGLHRLSDEKVLVASKAGWLRFDLHFNTAEALHAPATPSQVTNFIDLPGGDALVGTDEGLLLFGSKAGAVRAIPEARVGFVQSIVSLGTGNFLVQAKGGWFRFRADSGALRAIPASRAINEKPTERRLAARFNNLLLARSWLEGIFDFRYSLFVNHLPNDTALITTPFDLGFVPFNPLTKAKFTPTTRLGALVPQSEAVEVNAKLSHECAPAIENLGLTMVASINGREKPPARIRPADGAPSSGQEANIAGSTAIDALGDWNLVLKQGDLQLGDPVRFSLSNPMIERVWPTIAAVGSGIYVLSFVLLLWSTHRHARAFRMLGDQGWARLLTWPFFFLRHFPIVQRWVLEPWFQAVRDATRTDIRFADVPIKRDDGLVVPAESLLNRLRVSPRLWLQGESGMGKTSAFAAWERGFFAAKDDSTLVAAVRRYGFILITLPVRHYAVLLAPESGRPQTWVIEAVRLRLEEFGLATRDLSLVEDILKSGSVALAMDGANEADRDDALNSFARQFPQVRLLVTSQTAPSQGWEVWQLPNDLQDLREDLLALWLGPESATKIANRIDLERLSDTIVSGYDLRLIAELTRHDPVNAPLPSSRVALYRTMLERAIGPDRQWSKLQGLKQLAWTMLVERRREIRPTDVGPVGADIMTALSMEGVRIVHRVGASYEFRHDQMCAFLAALWLIEETPTISALEATMLEAGVFKLNPRDQQELWRFVVAMTRSPEVDLQELWQFANDDAKDRAILLATLQFEADSHNLTLVRKARRRYRPHR